MYVNPVILTELSSPGREKLREVEKRAPTRTQRRGKSAAFSSFTKRAAARIAGTLRRIGRVMISASIRMVKHPRWLATSPIKIVVIQMVNNEKRMVKRPPKTSGGGMKADISFHGQVRR